MSYTCITVAQAEGVATVTLDRPSVLNAITPSMIDELNTAFDALIADDAVRVIVLAGAGRAFCAGVDLKDLSGRDVSGGNVGDVLNTSCERLLSSIETAPKPVIAKVHGYCFTGGLELVLACDFIVAAEEAVFGDTHAIVGVKPSWGMSQRLPRAVGVRKAKELSFTARHVDGREAAAIGLANAVVSAADLDAHVEVLCAAIVNNSAGAIAAYKDLYHKQQRSHLDAGLVYEVEQDYGITDSQARIERLLKRKR